MSRSLDDREKKIGFIYGTMTGFCSVMRNLQENYKTCSKNYSEEALALLGFSNDFINSAEAIRTLGSIRTIDDDGINELFSLSRQIAELYRLEKQANRGDTIENLGNDIARLPALLPKLVGHLLRHPDSYKTVNGENRNLRGRDLLIITNQINHKSISIPVSSIANMKGFGLKDSLAEKKIHFDL